MKLLVTGANGMVGSSVCAELVRRGHEVRAAVRSGGVVFERVEQVVIGSINCDTDWTSALRNVDGVIHLAARVHVMRDPPTDPDAKFFEVNAAGTLALARQAAEAKVQRMIFTSSVKVNGEYTLPGKTFSEADTPNPHGGYAQSKYEAESSLRQVALATGMEVVIIRPPLVYGAGSKANFAALMRRVEQGWPLPLGALHNQRSLIGLANLVDFIITCLSHKQAANQTFLVSDGHDLSTTELIRRLALALEVPARLLPIPAWALMAGATLLGKQSIAQRVLGNLQIDISKAQRLLGWFPPVSVDESLRSAAAGTRYL
jgi:nucleoside-diphosphate-sugar epimerase